MCPAPRDRTRAMRWRCFRSDADRIGSDRRTVMRSIVRRRTTWFVTSGSVAAVILASACGGDAASKPSGDDGPTRTVSQSLQGNVSGEIQIDGPANAPPGADLFPNQGTPLNAGA